MVRLICAADSQQPGPAEAAGLPIAAPEHWRAQRDLPWLPSASKRLVYFYVTIDDTIDLPSECRFFHVSASPHLHRSTFADLPGFSFGPEYPQLPPLAASFCFFRASRTPPAEDHIRGVAACLSRRWPDHEGADYPDEGDSLDEHDLLRVDKETEASDTAADGPEDTRSVVEICFHDPGGIPIENLQGEDGSTLDFLSLVRIWLQNLLEGYRIAAAVPTTDGAYMSLGPFVLTVEIDLEAEVRTPPVLWTLESALRHFGDRMDPRVGGEALADATVLNAARLASGDPLMMYPTSVWTARRLAWVHAQYEAAVMHCVTAIEGLLSGVWLAIQWELGRDAAAAVRRLEGKDRMGVSVSQMLGWLGQDLGGRWDAANSPTVKTWNDEVRLLRNLIAHTGLRCHRIQAERALDLTFDLRKMVEAALLANIRRIPRVTYLTCGSDGIDAQFGDGTWDRRYCGIRNEPLWALALASWTHRGRAGEIAQTSMSGKLDTCMTGCVAHRRQPRAIGPDTSSEAW